MCRECNGYENEFSIENGILTIHKAYNDKGEQLRLEVAKTKPRSKYKYEVGDIISNKKLDVTIIAKVYGRPYGSESANYKFYITMCNKCGCITYKSEGDITKNGCGVCGSYSRIVYTGRNDIVTTHPYLAKQWHPTKNGSLLPTMVSRGNNKEVWWLCDECGHGGHDDWKVIINSRTCNNTGCPCCGDGMPYPEKLMTLVLKALGIDFTKQLTYDNGKHKYDFYVALWKAIFETHGIQHYEGWGHDKEDLIRQQNNDKYKHDDAINNHGILEENYNAVDCRYSTLEWCRPNIEKALSKYIDVSVLTDEDWQEFDTQAQKSLKLKVCKRWKEGKEVDKEISVSDLVKEFGVSNETIRGYLKWGNEKGLCEYDGEEELQAHHKRRSKEVYLVKPNSEKWFDKPMSQNELHKQSGINQSTISKYMQNGEPLSNNRGNAKYDPKYIGSYIMSVEDYNLKYGSN